MKNNYTIDIIQDINDIFPRKNGFNLPEPPKVAFEKDKIFVTHKAYGKDVTVWFKGNKEIEIFRAGLNELLKDRFNFRSVDYNYNWYNGNPVEGYRECIYKLFPDKVSK